MQRELDRQWADLEMVHSKDKTRRRHLRVGFSVIEVVVASSLLIIAMVPILKALTSAHASSALIERTTRSLILAQAKLDEIRARSIYDYDATFAEDDVSLGDSYLCNVQDSSVGSNLREIAVSVGHDLDGNAVLATGEIKVTLTTLIARRW
jgi:Tfp pilus assembly protein PilV